VTILEKIAAARRAEIETLKQTQPLEGFIGVLEALPPPRFKAALSTAEGINIVAEIKKASPSKGVLSEDFDPARLARLYCDGAAAAVSVLTETTHFQGSFEYLQTAREVSGLPVLCKDFVVDRYQIFHAKHQGADAILLIVALHSPGALARHLRVAGQVGLDCLVEVHSESELNIAIDAGAEIVGVNNRDLGDFSVSLEVSERLAAFIPREVISVSESGISTHADIARLQRSGYRNFLVGEAIMTSPDPIATLRMLQGL